MRLDLPVVASMTLGLLVVGGAGPVVASERSGAECGRPDSSAPAPRGQAPGSGRTAAPADGQLLEPAQPSAVRHGTSGDGDPVDGTADAARRESPRALVRRARRAYEGGAWARAARLYDRARVVLRDAQLHWCAARAHHRACRLDEAVRRYRAALSRDELSVERRRRAVNHLLDLGAARATGSAEARGRDGERPGRRDASDGPYELIGPTLPPNASNGGGSGAIEPLCAAGARSSTSSYELIDPVTDPGERDRKHSGYELIDPVTTRTRAPTSAKGGAAERGGSDYELLGPDLPTESP